VDWWVSALSLSFARTCTCPCACSFCFARAQFSNSHVTGGRLWATLELGHCVTGDNKAHGLRRSQAKSLRICAARPISDIGIPHLLRRLDGAHHVSHRPTQTRGGAASSVPGHASVRRAAAPWRGGSLPSSRPPRPFSTRQGDLPFLPRRRRRPTPVLLHSSSPDSITLLLRSRSTSRRRSPSASPPPPPTSPRCNPPPPPPPPPRTPSSTRRPRAGRRRPALPPPSASASPRSDSLRLPPGPAAPRPRLRCSRCRIKPVVGRRWRWWPR
jgi:hypothetical protein